ncbi:MAG: fructose-bisphosphatase class II, partial [Thermoanaerobacteraceae bacterium]|nr:fructose-bisphosphatase class II [Thermoanaerobacteraceae bacterium]
MYSAGEYDVIVIGAGHAGCEAALAAARWMGKGDKHAADQAAVEAMRAAFDR